MKFKNNKEESMSTSNTLILFFDSGQQTINTTLKKVTLPTDTISESINLSENLTSNTPFNIIETFDIGNLVTVYKKDKKWEGELILQKEKGVWIKESTDSKQKIWINKPDYIKVGIQDTLHVSFLSEHETCKRKIIFLRSNIEWKIVYHIYIDSVQIVSIDQRIIIKSDFEENTFFDKITFIPKSMLIERNKRQSSGVVYYEERSSSKDFISETPKIIEEDEIDFKLTNILITHKTKELAYQENIANILGQSDLLEKQKKLLFCEIPSNDYSQDYTVSSVNGFRIQNGDQQILNPGKIFFYKQKKLGMEILGSGFMNKTRPKEQFDLLINEFPRVYCKIEKQVTDIKKDEGGNKYIMKTIDLKIDVINTTDEDHNVMLKYFVGNKKYSTVPEIKIMNGYIEWYVDGLEKKTEQKMNIKIVLNEPYH